MYCFSFDPPPSYILLRTLCIIASRYFYCCSKLFIKRWCTPQCMIPSQIWTEARKMRYPSPSWACKWDQRTICIVQWRRWSSLYIYVYISSTNSIGVVCWEYQTPLAIGVDVGVVYYTIYVAANIYEPSSIDNCIKVLSLQFSMRSQDYVLI